MDLSKLADMDFNDMSKIAEMAKSMFEGEDLKRLMIRILPDMMYRGALDVWTNVVDRKELQLF